jgi:hypothetical protein
MTPVAGNAYPVVRHGSSLRRIHLQIRVMRVVSTLLQKTARVKVLPGNYCNNPKLNPNWTVCGRHAVIADKTPGQQKQL